MKAIFGNRRQLLLLSVLAVVLVAALVKMRGGGSTPSVASATRPPSSAATDVTPSEFGRSRRGRSEKAMDPNEVPILTTGDLDSARPRQAIGGRNLFDLRAPTLPPPPTSTPAPPAPPAPGQLQFVGPLLPPPPTPTPLPPEITFKFLGTFGPKDHPIAVIAKGADTVNVREGDVIFQHFIVRKIGYESIDVGFVGRDPKETRRLGLAQ